MVIRDHHEAYIDWDQFVANRHRLDANRTNGDSLAGPAREGLCLLQGILLCGECGRRLTVRYKGNGGLYPMYQCLWKHREGLTSRACIEVSSTPLDNVITNRAVNAITPVTIELALAALTSLEERDREIGAQWRMRIERARYDVDLAERRYEAVDPDNRLIAATLEQRWNEAMQRLDPPHRLGAIALEVQAFPKHRETARRSRAHHAVDARRLLAAIDLGHPADRQELRGTRPNEQPLQVFHLRVVAVLTGPKDPLLQPAYVALDLGPVDAGPVVESAASCRRFDEGHRLTSRQVPQGRGIAFGDTRRKWVPFRDGHRPIRPITGRPSLSPASSTSWPVSLPCGRATTRAGWELWGLPS